MRVQEHKCVRVQGHKGCNDTKGVWAQGNEGYEPPGETFTT